LGPIISQTTRQREKEETFLLFYLFFIFIYLFLFIYFLPWLRAEIFICAAMLVPYSERKPPSPTLWISARFRCINDIWGIRARGQICCSFRLTPFSL